jgi:hypothetical protein
MQTFDPLQTVRLIGQERQYIIEKKTTRGGFIFTCRTGHAL